MKPELKPVPDPTVLTTQQLFREIGTAREILETQIDGMQSAVTTRLDGMDKALVLVHASSEKLPSQVVAALRQLQELHEEKFRSIQIQFAERDTRTEQTSKDSKVAVDAALQAAKEAVGEQNKSSALAISKSEAATTKQIDAILTLIQSNTKNIDDKIDDIKSRVTSVESHKKGTGDSWALLISLAGVVLSVVMIIVVVMLHH